MLGATGRKAKVWRGAFSAGLLLAAALTAGCAGDPPKYLALIRGTTPEVVVHPFTLAPDIDAADHGDGDLGLRFAEYLAGALQERGVYAEVALPQRPVEGIAPDLGARYVIDGKLVQFEAATGERHFWSFSSAGHSVVAVTAQLADHAAPDSVQAAEAQETSRHGGSAKMEQLAGSAVRDLVDAYMPVLRPKKKK